MGAAVAAALRRLEPNSDGRLSPHWLLLCPLRRVEMSHTQRRTQEVIGWYCILHHIPRSVLPHRRQLVQRNWNTPLGPGSSHDLITFFPTKAAFDFFLSFCPRVMTSSVGVRCLRGPPPRPLPPPPAIVDRSTGSEVARVYTALSNAISARHRQEAAPQVPSQQAPPPTPHLQNLCLCLINTAVLSSDWTADYSWRPRCVCAFVSGCECV